MAAFLIDYENVSGSGGLRGVDLIDSTDTVILFYSKACPSIRRDEMDAILHSDCIFTARKLIQQHKNGLDFYIAAEAGALAEMGVSQIAIISKDKGYNAVLDYVKAKYECGCEICKAQSVEKAIAVLGMAEGRQRRKIVRERMQAVDIAEEYAKYQDKMSQLAMIRKALDANDYTDNAEQIIKYIADNDNILASRKSLYLGALHAFGREKGTKIYRMIKDAIKT